MAQEASGIQCCRLECCSKKSGSRPAILFAGHELSCRVAGLPEMEMWLFFFFWRILVV